MKTVSPNSTRILGQIGQTLAQDSFMNFEDLEGSPIDTEVVENWLSMQEEQDYADAIADTLLDIWKSGPSRDVKCIMRFYDDPTTRLEERQDVATFQQGDFDIVYMIKGYNQVTQGPRFGYETNLDALEDLPKSRNPVTNDVPAVACFNRVFPMGDTNIEIAVELIPDLLRAIWARRPTIVIPFGQSGSGKTYTLEGDDEVPGLIPRLIDTTILMIEATQPSTFIIMAQFAQIYKDKRIDLLVEDGDVVLGKLKPWPILIIYKRERKLGYTSRNGDVYEGFLIDDDMSCYDADGKLLGKPVKEYKKTLLEVVFQSLKEKHTPQELRQFQFDERKPDELFRRLACRMMGVQKDMLESISQWYGSSSSNPIVQKAQKKALLTVKNLIEYLQAKAFVSKSDLSNQVQHVPIDGFCLKRINSTQEFITMWRAASERRVTAATSNNETSSRATLTGKLSIAWSHPVYRDQYLPLALSTITFDDLPGAESAGDFTISDPHYKIRTLETNDIGSDLLKLGLLLGRKTAPSGRKVSEDIRSIDDRQAVTAIILTGKDNHSDVAQTLRFAHHAGTTLVHEMHDSLALRFFACIGSNQAADILNIAKELWDELVPATAADLVQRLKKALGSGSVPARKLTCPQVWPILSGVISVVLSRADPTIDSVQDVEQHVKRKLINKPGPGDNNASPPRSKTDPRPKHMVISRNAPGRNVPAARPVSREPPLRVVSPKISPRASPKMLPRTLKKAPREISPKVPPSARAGSLRYTNAERSRTDCAATKKFEKKRLTVNMLDDAKHYDAMRHELDRIYERVLKRVSGVEKVLHKKFGHLLHSLETIVGHSSDEFAGMEGDLLEMEAGLFALEGVEGCSFTRSDLEQIRETAATFVTIRDHTSVALDIVENMSIPIHDRVSRCKMCAHDDKSHASHNLCEEASHSSCDEASHNSR